MEPLWIGSEKMMKKAFLFSEEEVLKDKKDEFRKDESWKLGAKEILVSKKKKITITIYCLMLHQCKHKFLRHFVQLLSFP